MIVHWSNKWSLGLLNNNNVMFFSIFKRNFFNRKIERKFNNNIDCFDRLKAYYQTKNNKKLIFKNKQIQNIKEYIINLKETKLTYNEWKIFIRNGILSSCFLSNIFYIFKKRKSTKSFNEWFKFFKYSFSISLFLNYILQTTLKKEYEDELQEINNI